MMLGRRRGAKNKKKKLPRWFQLLPVAGIVVVFFFLVDVQTDVFFRTETPSLPTSGGGAASAAAGGAEISPSKLRGGGKLLLVNLPPPPPSSSSTSSLISRDDRIKVVADVRGNLGPPSVVVQNHPGTDWLKDRWQAASDMHGSSIPGVHWIILEFPGGLVTHVSKVVLDWEAAYSSDYRMDGSMDGTEWTTVFFDSRTTYDDRRRTVEEYGQSPGVKTKTPLHVVHTIAIDEKASSPIQFFRLYVRKSAMGWGVSLWQLDVYGHAEWKER